MLTSLLVLAHAGTGALWFGAMVYSLFVLRPRLPRMVSGNADQLEAAQLELASGNRWPTLGLIGVLWLSGIALVLVSDNYSPGWWLVVAVKTGMLGAATGLFWWVSWRAWPRRVFALPAELPALRRQFNLVAFTMTALVGASFALGVVL